MDWTRICSDKQEALEGNLKAYSKQWKWVKKIQEVVVLRTCLRAELQAIIFMHYDVAYFVTLPHGVILLWSTLKFEKERTAG